MDKRSSRSIAVYGPQRGSHGAFANVLGGGKSFVLTMVAVYLAAFRDWSSRLAPGGKPVVLLLSPTRQQSQIALGYVIGILETDELFARQFRAFAKSIGMLSGYCTSYVFWWSLNPFFFIKNKRAFWLTLGSALLFLIQAGIASAIDEISRMQKTG